MLPNLELSPLGWPRMQGRCSLLPSPPRLSRPWAPGSVGRSVSNAFRGPSGQHGARHVAGATQKHAERRRTLIRAPVCPSAPPVCRALPAGSCPQPGRAPGDQLDSRPGLQEADVGLSSLAFAGASWGSAPPAIGTELQVPPARETRSRARQSAEAQGPAPEPPRPQPHLRWSR